MFGKRWFPWSRGPRAAAIPMTDKQEQTSECLPAPKPLLCRHVCPMMLLSALCLLLLVTCIALSVMSAEKSSSRSERNYLLFDYQNITENYITVTSINTELQRENHILKDHNAALEKEAQLLNRTLIDFESRDLATTEELTKLIEEIDNMTKTNAPLTEEYAKVNQRSVEQEETLVNMSRIIADLSAFNNELQVEKEKAEETNKLVQDDYNKYQEQSMKETVNVQKVVKELREEKHNLSSLLEKGKTDLEQKKEELKGMAVQLQSMEEAYHSLDDYCPVVNQNTQERVCKKCAEGWTLFQTKCYYFSSLTLSWSSSRAWCQTHGADLVIINTKEEQSFIHETSHTVDRTNTRLWIGMSDIEQEAEWRWVDGRQVTTSSQYWLDRPGVGTEPDNWRSEDPEGEDCGHIDTSEEALHSWMDGSCKILYRWICEKNV